MYLIDAKCIDTLSVFIQNFHRLCISDSVQPIDLKQKEGKMVGCRGRCEFSGRCRYCECSTVLGVVSVLALLADVIVLGVVTSVCFVVV